MHPFQMECALFTDNTALFRACVKAIKLKGDAASRKRQRTKSASQEPKESEGPSSAPQLPIKSEESPIVSSSQNIPLYAAHARQICQHIRELADLVLERRKSYLLTSVNVYGHTNFMTDDDRRQFDADTDLAMKQCSRLVRNLELQLDNDPSLRQDDEYPHLKAVTFLLNVYLKNVCKIVAELREIHLKKTQHLNKICRLGNLVGMYGAKINEAARIGHSFAETRRTPTPDATNLNNASTGPVLYKRKSEETLVSDVHLADENSADDYTSVHEISPAEQAQLLAENKHLLERFIQRDSEIETIETQFAELQRLQQTFVEKVIEQEKDIEVIHEKTIHTLDNLEQANEFIREAIKNSASRRVIALFCLIVLTFTLLFLDWYNP